MAKKIPTAAALKQLDALRADYENGLWAGLFAADYVPADGDTAATYAAIEASFPGYSRKPITNWTDPATVAGRAQMQADLMQWTCEATSGDDEVFGIFVLDGTGALRWAERDPGAPVRMSVENDTYFVVPVDTYKSEF